MREVAFEHDKSNQDAKDPGSMELPVSRWRVRLRRLKRWSRYEGRASDGQFDTSDLPEDDDNQETPHQRVQPKRHSLTSVETLRGFDASQFSRTHAPLQYDRSIPVVPPVRIPSAYRLQDRQRGVRVGGDRVPFTLDGHRRRRKMVRPLTCVEEREPLELETLPDMRNSMAHVFVVKARSRRACSV